MDLHAFLTELALDPILVEEFLEDPERVMDIHEVPAAVRPVLCGGEDVPILRALLDGDGESATADDEADAGEPATG